MNRPTFLLSMTLMGLGWGLLSLGAQTGYEPKPADPYFEKFNLRRAPEPGPLLLKTGDRLAIVGDSITEQKLYSRLIETYLTVCVPDLKVTARQYGWSGETAAGFLKRMDQDCLRFQPTVATFCYGMNDAKYRPYDDLNGEWYRDNYTALVRAFKAAGARVVLGSPGISSKLASWVKTKSGTLDELNLNLGALRDIGIGIAQREEVRFADIFWPMFKAEVEGRKRYGESDGRPYSLAGKDGVHPGWAGQLVMAYAFLRAMGLDGDLGTVSVDMSAGKATAVAGHTVDAFANQVVRLTSVRYPFCATGETNLDASLRSGMTLIPFNAQLNRFMLILTGGTAAQYRVTWGAKTMTYETTRLAKGVNLAEDFEENPFSGAFKKVDEAVAAKQAYETKQIKQVIHNAKGKADVDAAVARTEAERAPLVEAIRAAFVPVKHEIKIAPVP
ncbi:MAG: SGNH/GDSL hydrolase family protein [Verrucomicrobiota bacterium]